MARRCEPQADGGMWRGDLLVHGPDLYCDESFTLISEEIKVDGNSVKASCCTPVTTTTISTTTTTTVSTTMETSKF